MNDIKKKNLKVFPAFTWILFGLLTIYLLLRAYFLEPLHDEVATFFYYIESGVYWGPDLKIDANNHLLNSWLGHWMYLVFGDNFFFVRLPNVLAFVFYFWGIYRFIQPVKPSLYKALILLGTTCIPFILEYFANARGYGLSLGLFIFALSYIRDFIVHRNVKSAYWSSLLLCLAVYANLNFILSVILLLLLFVLVQWMHRKKLSKKQHGALILNYVLLGVLMIPNFNYALLLKNNGALYYGSLDGFWNVTGKSLAKNIVFLDAQWLKYASIVIILLLVYFLLRRWIKIGSHQFFTKSYTLLAWFLVGNCVAIVVMAKLLDINYPADRVGMYLAVLSILFISFVLVKVKFLNWLLFGMLFFPITMVPRINLSTSVFSPDQRMSSEFYHQVNNEIEPHSTVSAYPLQQLVWYYFSRDLKPRSFVNAQREFNHASDIVMTKTTIIDKNEDYLKDYEVIAENPESTFIAYKRKTPFKKEVIYEQPLEIVDAEEEYITIFSSEIPDSLRNKRLQFHIRAEVEAENKFREFAVLVYSTLDKEEQTKDYQYVNERWRQGLDKKFMLDFNYATEGLSAEENEIRIYMWNQKNEKTTIKNGVFQILELTE